MPSPRHLSLLAVVLMALSAPSASAAAAPAPAKAPTIGAVADPNENIVYPVNAAVVDVTKPPYEAKGNGTTDCTAILQRALTDVMGTHKILYFPNGVYLVSATLKWSKKNSAGGDAWGFNFLQGQNREKAIIRLKDGVFKDASNPQSIMHCGGFGSADWFHNYVQNLTFDVGKGNPGAIGLQFYSNNVGAARGLNIISGDGQGLIGLDLAFADMNGPLLCKDIVVQGFATGIRTGAAVNSQTFERITLKGQTTIGMENDGQCISVRSLLVEGSSPAIKSKGLLALLDARLTGTGAAAKVPAITHDAWKRGGMFLRNITTSGYKTAVVSSGSAENLGPVPAPTGNTIDEWCSNKPTSPFPSGTKSLGLPIMETPDLPWDDPAKWAVVEDFGANGETDASDGIQKAIDSGATTVFFPKSYVISKPIIVRGKVRRIIGVGNWVDYDKKIKPDFRIVDGDSPVVSIEHFEPINGGISIETNRTVILRSVGCDTVTSTGTGDIFLEDVVCKAPSFGKQRVWGRQFNVENEGTHITNDGGAVWMLGYKTERGGTLVHTKNGGKTEIFGTFHYATTAGALAPQFVTENSSIYTFFDEVSYGDDYFRTIIRETRGGETKEVPVNTGWPYPYIGYPKP